MSLRHALMALLAATPMTGYTLAKQFDQSAAFVWHAPHSQIYPELRRLKDRPASSPAMRSRGVSAGPSGPTPSPTKDAPNCGGG